MIRSGGSLFGERQSIGGLVSILGAYLILLVVHVQKVNRSFCPSVYPSEVEIEIFSLPPRGDDGCIGPIGRILKSERSTPIISNW